MDRETVKLTLLAEALEMNWNSYTVYEPLAELDSFLDKDTAVKLAEALKSGFMLEVSVEEIMDDGFFRGYVAGLMLHDDSISLQKREEIARILEDNLLSVLKSADESLPSVDKFYGKTGDYDKRFFPLFGDKDKARSKSSLRENLSLFWYYSKDSYYIPLILWGNELASFLCENVDKQGLKSETTEKLKKIMVSVEASYPMSEAVRSLVGFQVPKAESDTSSQLPMLSLIMNKNVGAEEIVELIESITQYSVVNLMYAPVAMNRSDIAEERERAREIVFRVFDSLENSILAFVLNGGDELTINGFLYQIVLQNDFSKLFDRLTSLMEMLKAEFADAALLAVASALIDKEETKENVESFIEYLKAFRHSFGLVTAGFLLSSKYELEDNSFATEIKRDGKPDETDYYLLLELARDFLDDLELAYQEMITDYDHMGDLEDVFEELEEITEPCFVSADDSEEVEYSRVPMYTLINAVMRNNDLDDAIEAIAAYCDRYIFNFEFVNTLLYMPSKNMDKVMQLLLFSGEMAVGFIDDIADQDDEAYLMSKEESPSNREYLNLIEKYVEKLIYDKNYREASRVIEAIDPYVNPEDLDNLFTSMTIVRWRTKDFENLRIMLEAINEEDDPKALVVKALMNYFNKEVDAAEGIIIDILQELPDFIQYLLENDEPDEEDFDRADDGDVRSQKKIDAKLLAEEFREDWFKLKGGKDWLKKVQRVFDEVS
ncbi:hypothetical protein BG32_14015 [Mesotoga sp. HF07.pep.5.2.highcov]|uniref:hypothetical protein n=1 Tax=Mesotoga sp. HF07.pep.5.2.highcov TaxID=1462923 RepID=UPI000EF137A7|nr:hypothetical protein [Mesotoga sp. HF07.pep.5.2.highcov]RLL88060.1 hypothetical protein BG32_14015 [Mesotoga sp. HF07.pep.5.2.highcov]